MKRALPFRVAVVIPLSIISFIGAATLLQRWQSRPGVFYDLAQIREAVVFSPLDFLISLGAAIVIGLMAWWLMRPHARP